MSSNYVFKPKGEQRIPVLGTNDSKGLNIKPFRFLKSNRDQFVTKFITYRGPKLMHGKRGYWIEYWYRIPADLQDEYGGKEWKKFRVL